MFCHMVDGNTTEAYCIHLRSITQVQGLDNATETLANVGGFTSICLAANLQSEARVDQ